VLADNSGGWRNSAAAALEALRPKIGVFPRLGLQWQQGVLARLG
jgi:hypothetical protein